MSEQQWQPIETAPHVGWGNPPVDVLLWGRQLGVRTGRACQYPGLVYASVEYVGGNIAQEIATHWMPLPAPPTPEGSTR